MSKRVVAILLLPLSLVLIATVIITAEGDGGPVEPQATPAEAELHAFHVSAINNASTLYAIEQGDPPEVIEDLVDTSGESGGPYLPYIPLDPATGDPYWLDVFGSVGGPGEVEDLPGWQRMDSLSLALFATRMNEALWAAAAINAAVVRFEEDTGRLPETVLELYEIFDEDGEPYLPFSALPVDPFTEELYELDDNGEVVLNIPARFAYSEANPTPTQGDGGSVEAPGPGEPLDDYIYVPVSGSR